MPEALRSEIVAHARAEAPKEACGLVAGHGGVPTRAIRCLNVHATPITRYSMDPREQLRVFRQMDAHGEELLAIYHSHPVTEPYPSPTDRAEAHYPDAFFVLVSLRHPTPEVRAYRIQDDVVSEVELT